MLLIAPISTVIMLMVENPCALIKELSPSAICTEIVPKT